MTCKLPLNPAGSIQSLLEVFTAGSTLWTQLCGVSRDLTTTAYMTCHNPTAPPERSRHEGLQTLLNATASSDPLSSCSWWGSWSSVPQDE